MSDTFFSIVVPIYNTKKEFLKESLDSIFNIDYENYEILLIDDGSNSETKTFLESYNNHNVQIIKHPSNKGLPTSRKTGIENAKGDYVFFLDSDDIIAKNALKTLNNIIANYKSDVVMYSLPRFKDTIDNIVVEKDSFFKPGIVAKKDVLKELLSLHINSICCKCAKRELLLNILENGDPSIIMGEDLQQSTNLLLSASTFYYTDEDIYFYRINEENRYYNITNLNDMNYLLPTYNIVFDDGKNNDLLSTFKTSAIKSIIYRAFKLCNLKNYKQFINELNNLEIIKVVKAINEKSSFMNELVFSFITNKNYCILKVLAFLFNLIYKDY